MKKEEEKSYLNPVYRHPCPDPFVLKHLNEYWCYCTGFWQDRICFGILHSSNLIDWQEVGGAMKPLDSYSTCYWAPEVRYENGLFFMYYSVGNEENMQIRVATAEHPSGPFNDCGKRLTSEDFAIDPHVFEDEDGSLYLFYATDFLTHERVGTGTVVDRMLDPITLAGRPRPVTRARYEWQTYDPKRVEKGGLHWHTVEGSFVLKHKGRYYQMFSAGNWKNETYGVSYGITQDLSHPDEWTQSADAQKIFPILRTIPGQVIGPGHNSVVRGPDNRQLFCVYHRWDESVNDRVMAIDRLEWAGERMLILGPSTSPQPPPNRPTLMDFSSNALDKKSVWKLSGGQWTTGDKAITQTSMDSTAEAQHPITSSFFNMELNLRMHNDSGGTGTAGIKLASKRGTELYFGLIPERKQIVIRRHSTPDNEDPASELHYELPQDFQSDVYHLLRVEINGPRVRLAMDDNLFKWEGEISTDAKTIILSTQNAAATFAGFALTIGWEDLFIEAVREPASLGWQIESGEGDWRIVDQEMICDNAAEVPARLMKGEPLRQYEMVVNARSGDAVSTGGLYGFLPAIDINGRGVLISVEQDKSGYILRCNYDQDHIFRLKDDFDPRIYQQFRFRKEQGRLTIQHEGHILGEVPTPDTETRVGLYVHKTVAAFDMVRVTAIAE